MDSLLKGRIASFARTSCAMVILAAVFLFVAGRQSFAETYIRSNSFGKGIVYTVDDRGVMTVSGSGRMFDYSTPPLSKDEEVLRLVKMVIVQDGITYIGVNVFNGFSSLEEVYLPKTLEAIGEDAFLQCNSIKNIYFTGSSETWESISIHPSNESLNNCTVHCNVMTESEFFKINSGNESQIWEDPDLASRLSAPKFDISENTPLVIISISAVVIIIGLLCTVDVYKRLQKEKKDKEKSARKSDRVKAAKPQKEKEAKQSAENAGKEPRERLRKEIDAGRKESQEETKEAKRITTETQQVLDAVSKKQTIEENKQKSDANEE